MSKSQFFKSMLGFYTAPNEDNNTEHKRSKLTQKKRKPRVKRAMDFKVLREIGLEKNFDNILYDREEVEMIADDADFLNNYHMIAKKNGQIIKSIETKKGFKFLLNPTSERWISRFRVDFL